MWKIWGLTVFSNTSSGTQTWVVSLGRKPFRLISDFRFCKLLTLEITYNWSLIIQNSEKCTCLKLEPRLKPAHSKVKLHLEETANLFLLEGNSTLKIKIILPGKTSCRFIGYSLQEIYHSVLLMSALKHLVTTSLMSMILSRSMDTETYKSKKPWNPIWDECHAMCWI